MRLGCMSGGRKRRSNRRTMRGGQCGPHGDKCGGPEGGRRKRTNRRGNRRGNRRTMRGGQCTTHCGVPEL